MWTSTPFKTLEMLYYFKKLVIKSNLFWYIPVIEEAAAECERNIEMINYMNNLIDKVGLDYIQSIIDRNDAIAASKLMLGFFKGGEKNEL